MLFALILELPVFLIVVPVEGLAKLLLLNKCPSPKTLINEEEFTGLPITVLLENILLDGSV